MKKIYSKKITGLILALAICSFFAVRPLFAEGDKAMKAADKAGKELVKQFNNFVKDVTEMQGMTDAQKVDYIVKKGKERIWEETSERIKDAAKDKFLSYVEARSRADLFKSMIPQMMNGAIVEGKSVSAVWSAADAEIKSKLDTQMNAVKSGISAAQIGWAVYWTWKEKGAEEGCRELGQQVGEKIIEYFIPGWGWYKLSQEAVKAIGNYVVTYAFDTSLDAKMAIVLGVNDPRKNPMGFKDWIMNVDIASYVQREWDEQLAYGGWYLKGKGNEGEDMKNAIIKELEKLKTEVQQRSQVENQLRSNLEALDAKTKAASDSVNAVIDGASQEAQPVLALIDNYQASISGYRKADAQVVVGEDEKQYEEAAKREALQKQAVKYVKLDHSTILSAMEAAFDEIKEIGTNGYDQERLYQAYKTYQEIRNKAFSDKQAWIDTQMAEAQKILDGLSKTYKPQLNAISNQMARVVLNSPEYKSLAAQSYAIQTAYSNACRPYGSTASGYILQGEFRLDQQTLGAKEQVMVEEFRGRAMKMRMHLAEVAQKLQSKADQAALDYANEMAKLNEKAQSQLAFPDGWCSPNYYKSIVDNLGLGSEWQYEMQGDVVNQANRLDELKKNLQADSAISSALYAERLKIFNQYVTAARNLINEYENSVPKELQEKIQLKNGQSAVEYIGGVKNFDLVLNLNNSLIISAMNVLSINRVWGAYASMDEAAKLMEPSKVTDELDVAVSAVSRKRQELDPLMNADHLLVIYIYMERQLAEDNFMLRVPDVTLEQEKARQDDMFNLPDNGAFMFILPENMKGYAYLNNLKAVWEKFKDTVEKMKNLKKGIGNIVNYRTGLQKSLFSTLEQWDSIPERISVYEATLEVVTKEREKRLALTERYLKEGEAKFAEIEKDAYTLQSKVESLEKFKKDHINNNLSLYNAWSTHGKNDRLDKVIESWKALDKKVIELITKTKDAIEAEKRRSQAEWKAREAERIRLEEERKKKEEEQRKKEERSSVMGQYAVLNPRLNSYSLDGARGDLVLMKNDIKQGNIEITARLTTIDKVDRILISEDNGMTWEELPLQQTITYTFSPIPDKAYLPVLKIHNTFSDEQLLPVFGMVNSITYRDIDYQQIVTEAVKHLADAYETRNISQFSDLISQDFLGNKSFLEEGVRFDFDMFMDIKLSIYINRIEKRGDMFVAETKWDKAQVPRKTGQEQKTSGSTTMMFVLEDGKMKIKNLRGNLIYATLSPEIAQASGLTSSVISQIRTAYDDRNPTQPGAGTTLDSGGLTTTETTTSNIETGTFNLTQFHAVVVAGWIEEYDFSTNQVHAIDSIGPVYDFRRQGLLVEVKSTDGIEDLGAVSIDSVTEAPASGYSTDGTATAGHTYALQLSDGTYTLVYITSLSDVFFSPSSFQYKHQKNGTRNF